MSPEGAPKAAMFAPRRFQRKPAPVGGRPPAAQWANEGNEAREHFLDRERVAVALMFTVASSWSAGQQIVKVRGTPLTGSFFGWLRPAGNPTAPRDCRCSRSDLQESRPRLHRVAAVAGFAIPKAWRASGLAIKLDCHENPAPG